MTGRDRTVILVVLVLAAIAASWMLGVSPKRDEAAKLGGQISAAQTQLDSARALLEQGQAAKRAFARNYTAIARLGEAVPADDNVPSLIVQLQNAASAARVDFRSLQLNGSGGGAATSTPGSGAPSLPPGVTVGSAGFPTEPFTFTFRGNFFRLGNFLGRLQRFVVATNDRLSVSGRLMTLDAISLAAAPSGFPQITASIAATTYLVPPSEGLLSGATPAGPASAAPGASPSASGSSASASPSAPAPAAVVSTP